MHSILQETWRDIPGYWGEYQISNRGKIKMLGWIGAVYIVHDKVLIDRPSHPKKNRFYNIHRLNGTLFRNHQLTMLAFEGEKPKGLTINHKNGVQFENQTENVEYCTHQYNLNHAIQALGKKGTWHERYGKDNYKSKLVGQYDLRGKLIAKYCGTNEAMRITGVDSSTISKCCRNHPDYSHAGGFKWKYL